MLYYIKMSPQGTSYMHNEGTMTVECEIFVESVLRDER